jgi:biopolymer transport protein ExbD/biopolymer transport protein TolR
MAITTRDGRTKTVLSEINMVPFIDIVLVLLIIFMITAPVIQSGIQVEVPRVRAVKEVSEQLLVVTIDSNEGVYLQNREININSLAASVKQQLAAFKVPKVYLRSDRRVTWETIAAVLDRLKDGGINDIVFVTQPLEESR